MRTRYIPAIVTLLAGFLYCVIALIHHFPVNVFLKQLFIVLLIFLVLGSIIKVLLDVFMEKMEKQPENIEELSQEHLEHLEENVENDEVEDIRTEESDL